MANQPTRLKNARQAAQIVNKAERIDWFLYVRFNSNPDRIKKYYTAATGYVRRHAFDLRRITILAWKHKVPKKFMINFAVYSDNQLQTLIVKIPTLVDYIYSYVYYAVKKRE